MMQVERPLNLEVFQRVEGKADVPVRITGLRGHSIALAVADAAGKVVRGSRLEVESGAAETILPDLPQGGWYSLMVRGRELARFGVGDVFVVAGQSNAAGHGDGFIADRSGMVSVRTVSGRWKLAQDGEEMPAGMSVGSPWITMGELLALTEGVPVGIINVAVGGTSTEQWRPDAADNSLYRGLKEALTERRVRAVLWHQGESDCVGEIPTQRTFENMQAMITQSRVDAGYHVPWYVALATYVNGITAEKMEPTRSAQKAIHLHALAMPGPDTDTFVPPSMRHDGTHFGEVGLKVHGILWFMALRFPR